MSGDSKVPSGTRRGRPPKPTALKVLHGDFKGHPGLRNKAEPQITGPDVEPPKKLSPQAQEIWDYYAPILMQARILTKADRECLAEYAESTVVVKLTRARIMQYVTGKLEVRPGASNPFNEWNRAINVMTNLGARLGLSPSDRSRLQVSQSESTDDLIVNG